MEHRCIQFVFGLFGEQVVLSGSLHCFHLVFAWWTGFRLQFHAAWFRPASSSWPDTSTSSYTPHKLLGSCPSACVSRGLTCVKNGRCPCKWMFYYALMYLYGLPKFNMNFSAVEFFENRNNYGNGPSHPIHILFNFGLLVENNKVFNASLMRCNFEIEM